MIMRRIVLLFFAVLPLMAVAQTPKKVAVWETKCSDSSITPFQSTMVRGGMETAVGNTAGYEVYDRSAFDAIMKEHNFQRSGNVTDSDIKRLGVMAGVQYIIVPEATASGAEFYILVKMLDVETGKFGAVYEALCGTSGTEIKNACAELGAKLFGTSEVSSYSPTGGNINNLERQSGPKCIQIDNQNYEVMPGDLYGTYTWDEAVSACANLIAFGKSDWYLPNSSELLYLYNRKDEIGGFSDGWYWSSSDGKEQALDQRYSDGFRYGHDKTKKERVRCIRKN